MWLLAILTDDCINNGIFMRKCTAVLPINKRVAIRQGSTVF